MFFISDAFAQQAPAPQGAGAFNIFFLVIMVALMYFLMIRPQQKRAKEHRALIEALKKGDEVITSSGLMGRITALDQSAVDLEIADKVIVRMQRGYVVAVLPKGTLRQQLKEEVKKEENKKEEAKAELEKKD